MAMRRFNFMLDPELDERLERHARGKGISKGALLRRLIREHLDVPGRGNESLLALSGISDAEPAHHDDVIYPR